MEDGIIAHDKFIQERFQTNEKSLFDPIKKRRSRKKSNKIQTVIDNEKESATAFRYIDIPRARKYDITSY
jgi:hypothetical protein